MHGKGFEPPIGSRIREYELLEVIGKGGMGAVYRARHVYLDQQRAIKVIQSRLAGDKSFVERFIREAKLLVKLHHPNLVQIFEFGSLEEDTFFMVLELLEGQSVLDRIRENNRLPLLEAIEIVREAALGLHCAHQKGIIHRDISPDNLILVRDDEGKEITKVIDFGIAKPLFEPTHYHTVTNLFIGKPEYSSPEQCGMLNENEIIDRRSDIYSLAVTFYQMICGRLPFYAPTPQGYLVKHVSEAPKAPSEILPGSQFPELVDDIILKALSKRREVRYSSLDEFMIDLDRLSAVVSKQVRQVITQPVEDTSILKMGDIFARRYFIEAKLGEGGMGIVYKAIDKVLEIPVALKVMSNRLNLNENALARFKREVILARRVAHHNACRIYDYGEEGGVHYVSMELLGGTTLSKLLKEKGKLAPEVGIPVVKQILQALEEAHRVGVIHRDLKPQNIIVDQGRAVIMDFGLSISADLNRITQAGVLLGTPNYMAPEQFENRHVDHRADIYSLGVILYEMFTGVMPFEASSAMEVIYAHLKSIPRKPSEIVPNFPEQLEKIILKALQKEIQDRYRSVNEILTDLEPFLASSSNFQHREARAHKYLAERSYSKAIKCLNGMLESSPKNKNWMKLRHIAITEKSKRDVRRLKSLIRKNNLIQAQLMLEKILRFLAESGHSITGIERLEKLLSERREKAVLEYLAGAQKMAANNDVDGALLILESARNLNPANNRIITLQQELFTKQNGNSEISMQFKGEKPQESRKSEQQTHAFNDSKQYEELSNRTENALSTLSSGRAFQTNSSSSVPPASESDAPNNATLTGFQNMPLAPSTLVESHTARTPSERNYRRIIFVVAALGVLFLIVSAWLYPLFKSEKTSQRLHPTVSSASPIQVPVSINALPWAKVSVRTFSGDVLPLLKQDEEKTTPCSILLPAGKYQLELKNDAIHSKLTTQIVVDAQGQNSFLFVLPAFDPAKVAIENGADP